MKRAAFASLEAEGCSLSSSWPIDLEVSSDSHNRVQPISHQTCSFSLLCAEAHLPVIVWSTKSDGAGQPGMPEPRLIFRLISGRVSAGNNKVIQPAVRS